MHPSSSPKRKATNTTAAGWNVDTNHDVASSTHIAAGESTTAMPAVAMGHRLVPSIVAVGPRTPFTNSSLPATPSSATGVGSHHQPSVDHAGFSNMDLLFGAADDDDSDDDPDFDPLAPEETQESQSQGDDESNGPQTRRRRSREDRDDEEEDGEDEEYEEGEDDESSSADGDSESELARSTTQGSTARRSQADVVARRTRARNPQAEIVEDTLDQLEQALPIYESFGPCEWEQEDYQSQPLMDVSHPSLFDAPPAAPSTVGGDDDIPHVGGDDDAYQKFKLMLTKTDVQLDELDDEDADAEYRPDPAEFDEADDEEYRNDRTVSISKKELRQLQSDRIRNVPVAAPTTRKIKTRASTIAAPMSTRRRADGSMRAASHDVHLSVPSAAAAASSSNHTAAAASSSSSIFSPSNSLPPLPPLPTAANEGFIRLEHHQSLGGKKANKRKSKAPGASEAFASTYRPQPLRGNNMSLSQPTSSAAAAMNVPAGSVPHMFFSPDPAMSFLSSPPPMTQQQSGRYDGAAPASGSSGLGLVQLLSSGPPCPADAQPAMMPLMMQFMTNMMEYMRQMPAAQAAAAAGGSRERTISPTPILPIQEMPQRELQDPSQPVAKADFTEEQRVRLESQLKDHIQLLVQVRYLTINSVLTPLPRPVFKGGGVGKKGLKSSDEEEEEEKEPSLPKQRRIERREKESYEPLMSPWQIWTRTGEMLTDLVKKRDSAFTAWNRSQQNHDPYADPSDLDARPVLSRITLLDNWEKMHQLEQTQTHEEFTRAQDPYIPLCHRSLFPHMTSERKRHTLKDAAYFITDAVTSERPWSRSTNWCYTPLFYAYLMHDTQGFMRKELYPCITRIPRKIPWVPAEDALLDRGWLLFGQGKRPGKGQSHADFFRIRSRLLPGRTVYEIRRHHHNRKSQGTKHLFMAIAQHAQTRVQEVFADEAKEDHSMSLDFMELDGDDHMQEDGEQKNHAPPASSSSASHIPPILPLINSTFTPAQLAMLNAAQAATNAAIATSMAAAARIKQEQSRAPPSRSQGGSLRELTPDEIIRLDHGCAYFPDGYKHRWKNIVEMFLPDWDRMALRKAWVKLNLQRERELQRENAQETYNPIATVSGKYGGHVQKHRPIPLSALMKTFGNGQNDPVSVLKLVKQFDPLPPPPSTNASVSVSVPPSSANASVTHANSAHLNPTDSMEFDEVDMTIEEEQERHEAQVAGSKASAAPAAYPHSSIGVRSTSLLPASTFSATTTTPHAAPVAHAASAEAFELMEDVEETSSEDQSENHAPAANASARLATPVKATRSSSTQDGSAPMDIDSHTTPKKAASTTATSTTTRTPRSTRKTPQKRARAEDANLASAIVALKKPDEAAQPTPRRSTSQGARASASPLSTSIVALANTSELVETVPAPLLAPVPEQLSYSAEQYAYASAAIGASPMRRPMDSSEVTRHMQLRQRTPTALTAAQASPSFGFTITPGPAAPATQPVSTRPPPRSARVLAETTMQREASANRAAAAAQQTTEWSRINDSVRASTMLLQGQGIHVRPATSSAMHVSLPAPLAATRPHDESPKKKQRLEDGSAAPSQSTALSLTPNETWLVRAAKLEGSLDVAKWSETSRTRALQSEIPGAPRRSVEEANQNVRKLVMVFKQIASNKKTSAQTS